METKNFEFDGVSVPMARFNTYAQSLKFSDSCIPIIMNHIRPIEQVLAAWVNGRAPMDFTWGITDLLLVSEADMNGNSLTAFKCLIGCYLPDRNYTEKHLESLLPNVAKVQEFVMHQMELEEVVDFYCKRKTVFITQMAMALNFDINGSQVMKRTEGAIRDIIKNRNADPELSNVGAG